MKKRIIIPAILISIISISIGFITSFAFASKEKELVLEPISDDNHQMLEYQFCKSMEDNDFLEPEIPASISTLKEFHSFKETDPNLYSNYLNGIKELELKSANEYFCIYFKTEGIEEILNSDIFTSKNKEEYSLSKDTSKIIEQYLFIKGKEYLLNGTDDFLKQVFNRLEPMQIGFDIHITRVPLLINNYCLAYIFKHYKDINYNDRTFFYNETYECDENNNTGYHTDNFEYYKYLLAYPNINIDDYKEWKTFQKTINFIDYFGIKIEVNNNKEIIKERQSINKGTIIEDYDSYILELEKFIIKKEYIEETRTHLNSNTPVTYYYCEICYDYQAVLDFYEIKGVINHE